MNPTTDSALGAFYGRMSAVCRNLECCCMALAFGEGGTLRLEKRPPWPIPRPHLEYTPGTRWAEDEIKLSLEGATSALREVQEAAAEMPATDVPQDISRECVWVADETNVVVESVKELTGMSRRLVGRGAKTHRRRAVIRARAINALSDLRLVENEYQDIWKGYLTRLKFEADLASERARTQEALAEMSRLQGNAEAEVEARQLAEAERRKAENALLREAALRSQAEEECDRLEKEILGKLAAMGDMIRATNENVEKARVAAENGEKAALESKGILTRFWNWFRGLRGWPGKGKGEKGGKPRYPPEMIQEAIRRMENVTQYGDKKQIASEVLQEWKIKMRRSGDLRVKYLEGNNALPNFIRAIQWHQQRD